MYSCKLYKSTLKLIFIPSEVFLLLCYYDHMQQQEIEIRDGNLFIRHVSYWFSKGIENSVYFHKFRVPPYLSLYPSIFPTGSFMMTSQA